MPTHLFLLVLNNSGSSALMKVIGRCARAVCFPRVRDLVPTAQGEMGEMIAEGQMLFGVGPGALGPQPGPLGVPRIFTEKAALFADPARYDWPEIRARWDAQWRRDPRAGAADAVLVEKSPTNLLRSAMLEEQFPDARFLVMTRDPYAVCEGIRRRHGYALERCARHWIRGARAQAEALDRRRHVAGITYEALAAQDPAARDRIVALVPALDDLALDVAFAVHSMDGAVERSLVNLNGRQLARLAPEEFDRIGRVLREEGADLLERFGYRLREAGEID